MLDLNTLKHFKKQHSTECWSHSRPSLKQFGGRSQFMYMYRLKSKTGTNNTQTQVTQNKKIGGGTKRIRNIMKYTKAEGLPGAIIAMDFLKAFAPVDRDYTLTALQASNWVEMP